MLLLRHVKTSALFVLAKRASVTRAPLSTEWSPTSCCKVVTLQTTMALVESPSTVRSSLMRTSSWSTPALVYSQWLMLAPTPTGLNSSSLLWRHPGWMGDTSSSETWLRAWKLSSKLRASVPNLANPLRKLSSLTVASFAKLIECNI